MSHISRTITSLSGSFGVFQPGRQSLVVWAYCGYAPANPTGHWQSPWDYLNSPFVIGGVIPVRTHNLMISFCKATQILRLMQTINALPSAADKRCSKWLTRSAAICFKRLSLPTTASLLDHFAKRFCRSVNSSVSVTSSTRSSKKFRSCSESSIFARRLS